MYIIKNKYKEHSTRSKEEIAKMQHEHRYDIIQPREANTGLVNPDYIRMHGAKGMKLDEADIKHIAKNNKDLLPYVQISD
jgi:hypothetical protein